MSSIVLSASVRQNLLSLQSTADLLSTTQNRLATGNKVNSALDNPTNFFTAAGLNNRANDINNLLDSIGNGVQVLQAANTGITSLQKLVDTAKSIANQVLQAPVGYSAKSTVTSTALGATATADDLVDGTTAHNRRRSVYHGYRVATRHSASPSPPRTSLADLNMALAASNLSASSRQHQQARLYHDQRYGVVHDRRDYRCAAPPVPRPSAAAPPRRLPMRLRRPFARAW